MCDVAKLRQGFHLSKLFNTFFIVCRLRVICCCNFGRSESMYSYRAATVQGCALFVCV